MGPDERLPKQERLAEFFRRRAAAPAAASFAEAYRLVCATLGAVEDELTGLPNEPERWMELDRMFPPQMDSLREVEGRPDVKRFASRAHNTLIAENGAIEIRDAARRIVFTKPGADGRRI